MLSLPSAQSRFYIKTEQLTFINLAKGVMKVINHESKKGSHKSWSDQGKDMDL